MHLCEKSSFHVWAVLRESNEAILSWKCWTNCFNCKEGTVVRVLYRTESYLFKSIKKYFSYLNNQQLCLPAEIPIIKLLSQESVFPVNRMLAKLYQSIGISACFTVKLLLKVKTHPARSSSCLFFKQQLNHLNDT